MRIRDRKINIEKWNILNDIIRNLKRLKIFAEDILYISNIESDSLSKEKLSNIAFSVAGKTDSWPKEKIYLFNPT